MFVLQPLLSKSGVFGISQNIPQRHQTKTDKDLFEVFFDVKDNALSWEKVHESWVEKPR
jgi:hypothetical protein